MDTTNSTTQNQETRTYSGKKALLLYGENYSKEKEINIYDELEYRNRIIEELAGMSLENDPLLNCKEELKDIPLVFWPKDAWENKEHEKINEILEKKEEEFNKLLSELIVEQMPELKMKEGDYLCFHESYKISKEDKEKNIFFCSTLDKYNDSEREETSELSDLFEAQKELADKIVLSEYKGDFDKLKPLNFTAKDAENLDELLQELTMTSTSFEFNFERAQDKTLDERERKIARIAMLKSIESTQGVWADIYKLLNKK